MSESLSQKEPIIKLNALHKSFKDVHAVNGINLNLYPGEFIAVLGPNGAGKTTLVEMIEGIQVPDSGEIFIKGMHWRHHHAELNRLLGISLQETWFIDKLTVKETLILFASFYKLGADRVNEIIELIRLTEKQKAYVKNLSGGQRQRLALGIALLNYPEVLILDEPTTGLDPNARRELWDILLKLKAEFNTSMILTTHYMEEAEFLCDRIIIMDHGKVLAKGKLNELLLACDKHEVIEIGFEGPPPVDFKEIEGVQNSRFNAKDNTHVLDVLKIVESLPILLKRLEEKGKAIKSLECRTMTLDDLFISMTGRHLNS
ncbi:MAG: ABC transporter ATP-binding protein [Bacteroidales bacterium]|nr:ABC transporter ATP-binding protein [Bacteroidales bacterium]